MTKCEEQFEIKLGSDFLLRVGKHSKNTAKPASTAESCAWAIQLADCPSALSSSDLFIFTLLSSSLLHATSTQLTTHHPGLLRTGLNVQLLY